MQKIHRQFYSFLRPVQGKLAAALVFFTACTAQADEKGRDILPQDLARQHCLTLLMAANGTAPISATAFHSLVGDDMATALYSDDTVLDGLLQATGGMPDWRFVLEDRIGFANRVQFRTLHQAMTQYMVQHFGIARHGVRFRDACRMDTHIEAIPGLADDIIEKRHLNTLARTKIPGAKGEIFLSYRLEKPPHSGWRITEMTIRDTPIAARLGGDWQQIIVSQGFDGLTGALLKP